MPFQSIYLCHQFRISVTRRNRECVHDIFLSPSMKEWLKQRYFSSYVKNTSLYFLCQFWHCRMSCSQVLRSALSVSAQINCNIIHVSSLVTEFVNFDPETFVFLGHILSKNEPSSTARRLGDRNLRFCESPPMTAEKGIFTPTKRQCSEMPRYSSCCIALILQTSLFISICQTEMKL